MLIKLRKPFFPQSSIDIIQKKINKCLKNGYLTLGENLTAFESEFAKFQQMKYAAGVSSGTSGLHLSLLSLGIKRGDEVIVPDKTFISTANAVIFCNAKPIFCDVDEESFQMDISKLQKLITKKTRAIIPVHLAGNMCPMNEIMEIAEKHDIHVVEDAAHAHGATLNNKKSGSFGSLGVFSFYPDKIMASSDGGIVVTNNYTLYEKIISLRNVGRAKLGNYDFTTIGYNYRMNEIQAILAREQLRLLPTMLKLRREIAQIYDSRFTDYVNLKPQKISPNVRPSFYAYVLRLKKGNLNSFRKKLARKGVETSPMFTSLHNMKPYVELFGKRKGLCPVTEKLDNQTFTIPLHPAMNKKEVDHVVRSITYISN